MTSPLGDHLLGEVPPPVLFNTWKHHAGALRQRIAEAVRAGAASFARPKSSSFTPDFVSITLPGFRSR